MPYIRRQEEIFGEEGSLHREKTSDRSSPGYGADNFLNLTESDTNITDGKNTDVLIARSATSPRRPDMRALDEDVTSFLSPKCISKQPVTATRNAPLSQEIQIIMSQHF